MYKSIFVTLLSVLATHEASAARTINSKAPSARREMGTINPIASRAEYDRIAKGNGPTIIVFNSKACTACDQHKDALEPVAAEYKRADFYSFDASGDDLKTFREEHKIAGYPTTQFINKGKKRSEMGSMGEQELGGIVYEMVTGKRKIPKPIKKEAPQKAAESPTEKAKTEKK